MAGIKEESLPLHKAVEYRNMHKIKILLPKTKDINKKSNKGYTVLLLACEQNDNGDVFDALLTRKDIDITVTNNDGFTALHLLAFRGNFKGIVKVLRAFPNADINAKNDKGNTPLIMACKLNHLEIIQHLLSRGLYENKLGNVVHAAYHAKLNAYIGFILNRLKHLTGLMMKCYSNFENNK